MHWVVFAFEMLIPLGTSVYTVNFGRWMWNRQHKSGAVGAYVISVLSLGTAFLSLWHASTF